MLREGENGYRIPAGCAISAIINKRGERFSGEGIIASIKVMHERSNGLGGGFAAYGIYPEYKEHYAFHVFYEGDEARSRTEEFINQNYEVESCGKIPTRKVRSISGAPQIWRYFVRPKQYRMAAMEFTEDEYTARTVTHINSNFAGAYVFSSGKNMGAFKAVGYPEDVGEFYMLDEYKGFSWTAHGRFPTNTPGWWGGAHPFTLLDWSIVHNGEISSYDANRRYVEMFGYKCSLMTDTEVITYLFDLLVRKHNLPMETAAHVLAAPTWDVIESMDKDMRDYFTTLRTVYSGALVNGPFSIILGSSDGLLALNDRLKLRSLMGATAGDMVYFASEEAAIREICEPERVWSIGGGEPVIVKVEGGME
ncbi:MAG: glutamine amidotransferase family protein [Clostridia bacterium]|nr:glutamine amidotransferase family protein [Clostridia bacterium]